MITIIAIILISIFLTLSGIHVYWALGGKWGTTAVIPTKDDEVKTMMPSVAMTLFVAFGLLGFGLIVLANAMELNFGFPSCFYFIRQYGLWVIASIFGLRAIGEFHYLGFFKQHKHTKFAQKDTKYYSPLCLLIAILTLILELNK